MVSRARSGRWSRWGNAALLLSLAACSRRPDDVPVVASVIGAPPRLTDASRRPLGAADRVLADSVAQGLVRFDASGGVEPGLAARWIVIDGGRTYIFRLRRTRWADGSPVVASQVAAALSRQLRPGSRNALAPFLSAVRQVRAMTPDVIEVDLARPRTDLLKLFAQPELSIARPVRGRWLGAGPFRAQGADGSLLIPMIEPDRDRDDAAPSRPEDQVRLIGERAAMAVLRFRGKRSDLVSGGTIADWPLVAAAGIARSNVRIDPAAGLFGLAVTRRTGLLAAPEGRAAVAQAIDRSALTTALARDWSPTEQLLPDALDSAAAPALADWVAAAIEDRRTAAREVVARWRQSSGTAPSLTLALPAGAGGTRLWARLAVDLMSIGIRPVRVGPEAAADLTLVDAVAPYDSARWYLVEACRACGGAAQDAIEAARVATTLEARADAIATADRALAADGGYIPIARPFRWSLVATRLRQWQPNARAWHPLNRLRHDRN